MSGRYGISDPSALRAATGLSARAGFGFFLAGLALSLSHGGASEVTAPQDMVSPRVMAVVLSYLFLSVALLTSARRKTLEASADTPLHTRLIVMGMFGVGGIVLLMSLVTLAAIATVILGGTVPA